MKKSTLTLLRGFRHMRRMMKGPREYRTQHLAKIRTIRNARESLLDIYSNRPMEPDAAKSWDEAQTPAVDPYPHGLELFYFAGGNGHGHGGPYLTLPAARRAARRLLAGAKALDTIHIVSRTPIDPDPTMLTRKPGAYGRLITRVAKLDDGDIVEQDF